MAAVINSTQNQEQLNDKSNQGDIAVVGMACRFAGANTIDEFWKNISEQRNCISEVPRQRWNSDEYYSPISDQHNNTSVSKWAGFIDDIDCFDAAFFHISAREAEFMDPQQRLALETAWHCIEHAGYNPQSLFGQDIGLYLAIAGGDYKELQEKRRPLTDAYEATGVHNSVAANRISYFFDWHGPSVVVDTACSSSLVAIHHALSALQRGECESALVGGVNLLITPTTFVRFSKMGMLSPSGQCHAFDEKADGYVRGEGLGFVYLKRLEDALRDQDNILGVIKSAAINHGGRARSLTSPSAIAQSKVIAQAIQQANIPAASITYIEAHGTGTPLGDPIEIAGLKRAFRRATQDRASNPTGDDVIAGRCALGTVKTNIGHLEPAAGMAGLIKVLLALQHRQLPPNQNFETVNPRLKLTNTPFYIADQLQPWQALTDENGQAVPLRAGISSFGFGGVNGHIIVEEAPVSQNALSPSAPIQDAHIITLSAHSKSALTSLIRSYIDYFHRNKDQVHVGKLCQSINQTRAQFRWRFATVVSSADELLECFEQHLNPADKHEDRVYGSGLSADNTAAIQALFFSEGAKYADQAPYWYQSHRVFRQVMDRCTQFKRELTDWGCAQMTDDKQVLDGQSKISTALLNALCDLYCLGLDIDFDEYYQGEQPDNSIQLPLYPFDKHRYWLDEYVDDEPKQTLSPSSPAKLLHSPRTLSFKNNIIHSFECQLPQAYGDYLFDHRVRDRAIMPATAYMGLMTSALSAISAQAVQQSFQLSNIHFLQPLLFNKGDAIDFQVNGIGSEGDEHFSMELLRPNDQCWIKHVTADASVIAASEQQGPPAVIAQDFEYVAPETLYQYCAQQGLAYGQAFRAVDKVGVKGERIYAEVVLPKHVPALPANTFAIHPVILDACFQTIAARIVLSNPHGAQVFLPSAIQRFQLHGLPLGRVRVYTTVTNDWQAEAKILADLQLFDDSNHCVASIEGLTLNHVEKTQTEHFQTKSEHQLSQQHKQVSSVDGLIKPLPLSRIMDLPSEAMEEAILNGLIHILSQVLQDDVLANYQDKAEFSSSPITALGVDSLATIELRSEINDWVNVSVPADRVVGGSAINDIVSFIHHKLVLTAAAVDVKESTDDDTEVFVL